MTDTIAPTYTVTGENRETGAPVIRAQVRQADVAAEIRRMVAEGLCRIRSAATPNPSGSAG
jgi:hypothetical protein